jgi:HPt (histidine-containing phosphotransfer) domain-containing protein
MSITHDPKPATECADFDSDELLDRIEGDRALFKDIIRIFLDDTPGLIATLGEGVKSGNADAVENAAHAIKGSCAMISAKRMEKLAHEFEIMGRSRDVSGSGELFCALLESFDTLKRIMASFLEKKG